jgi:hypothetical protein
MEGGDGIVSAARQATIETAAPLARRARAVAIREVDRNLILRRERQKVKGDILIAAKFNRWPIELSI